MSLRDMREIRRSRRAYQGTLNEIGLPPSMELKGVHDAVDKAFHNLVKRDPNFRRFLRAQNGTHYDEDGTYLPKESAFNRVDE